MPSTYEPIQTTTLGSTANTVTFSSIPQTYTDLVIVYRGTVDAGVLNRIQFNGDTTVTNYIDIMGYGNGSAMYYAIYNDSWLYNLSAGVNEHFMGIISINNYSNSTTQKTYLARWDSPVVLGTYMTTGIWNNTSAINSISLKTSSNNFNANSIFTLFGIKAAS